MRLALVKELVEPPRLNHGNIGRCCSVICWGYLQPQLACVPNQETLYSSHNKAGHIFELNVLVNYSLYSLLMILLVDLEVLPWGPISEILQTTLFFSYLLAVTGSQIETVIFLKTLDVNTMVTNTAGHIIAALTFCSLSLAVTTTLAKPSWNVNERKTEYCEFITPKAFYRTTIPSTVALW